MKQVKKLTDMIKNSTSLDTLTTAQAQGLSVRMRAWLDLGESYDIFTQRTEKQSSSVIFVYKTEAVS